MRRAAIGLRRLIDAFCSLVWDARCAACREVLASPTAGPVCHACWARVRRPPAGAVALARDGGVLVGGAGIYDDTLRQIVHAFKYAGHRSLAGSLAELMAERGREVLVGADLVVPVPLHVAKRWRRGFNQAEDLARRLPLPMRDVLRRARGTRAQAGLDAQRRALNVAGAFAPAWRLRVADRFGRGAGPLARAVRRWSVRGHVVVLVDDVRTTGATLEACARVLRQHGAREVRALTAALVPRR